MCEYSLTILVICVYLYCWLLRSLSLGIYENDKVFVYLCHRILHMNTLSSFVVVVAGDITFVHRCCL